MESAAGMGFLHIKKRPAAQMRRGRRGGQPLHLDSEADAEKRSVKAVFPRQRPRKPYPTFRFSVNNAKNGVQNTTVGEENVVFLFDFGFMAFVCLPISFGRVIIIKLIYLEY